MMTWEWQMWRCFDNVREIFEEKGWEYGLNGRLDNEAMPLLAESGNLHVVFYERNPGTGECWFELRNEARRSVVYVRGTENLPTPERARALLESYGAPLRAIGSPVSARFTSYHSRRYQRPVDATLREQDVLDLSEVSSEILRVGKTSISAITPGLAAS